MGLLDFLASNSDTSYGYKTLRNPKGWNNDRMIELLSDKNSPYGAPKFGWIRAFGKERQVIVYDGANKTNYIYVDATPKKIIISMAPKPGQIGGAKDHIDPEDVDEVNPDTVCATLNSMEPVDRIIDIVKEILEENK